MAHIFLSWSKPEGREVASCLKDFLLKALNIQNSEEIFINDSVKFEVVQPWLSR